jgi:hypothetical protein
LWTRTWKRSSIMPAISRNDGPGNPSGSTRSGPFASGEDVEPIAIHPLGAPR